MTKEEKNGITQDLLTDLLEYSEGKLIYRKPRRLRLAGDEAGWLDKSGYRYVKINRISYRSHRLIFLMHHGFVTAEIDHIDGDCTNNRIENLQPISHRDNIRKSKIYSTNKSGVKGVSLACGYSDRWVATLRLNGKSIYLGIFYVFQDAVDARRAAELKYHTDEQVKGAE